MTAAVPILSVETSGYPPAPPAENRIAKQQARVWSCKDKCEIYARVCYEVKEERGYAVYRLVAVEPL